MNSNPSDKSGEASMQCRILTCVYCGHEYPQDTPPHSDSVLTEHISTCEKHPLRTVIAQRDKLRSALAGLLGASTKNELDQLEMGVRMAPAGDEDRAVALNAISALRTCEG
jgi:hypothetical protein